MAGLIYGATSTLTLITTYSFTGFLPSITIPTPISTQPTLYTTILEPTVLPILILTEIVGVLVDASSVPVVTNTVLQIPATRTTTVTMQGSASNAATATTTGAGNNDTEYVSCSKFSCWPRPQQIGTIIAGIVVGFMMIGLLFYAKCRRDRRKSNRSRGDSSGNRDVEMQPTISRERRRGRRHSVDSPTTSTRVNDGSTAGKQKHKREKKKKVGTFEVTRAVRDRTPDWARR